MFLNCFYFLEGNCEKTWQFQCPETNECISKVWICDYDKDCVDGSDELRHCNGKSSEILSII